VENEQLKIKLDELQSTVRYLEQDKRDIQLQLYDQQDEYTNHPPCQSDFVKELIEKHTLQLETQLEKQAVKYETRLRDQEFQYNEHLDKLEARLETVAIKAIETPTTTLVNTNNTNNNNVNNYIAQMENVTNDRFQQCTQFLTHEYIKKGINGYVEYALDFPLNNRIVCVDLARKKIKYKDQDGNLVTDPNMEILGKQLFESIQGRNEELNKEQIEQLKQEREKNKYEPGDGVEEYLDARCKITEKRTFVNYSASGKTSEQTSYKTFVKKICEKTYIN
jgi:hypothetical protein